MLRDFDQLLRDSGCAGTKMAVPNAADKSATGCEPIDSVMREETFVFGSKNGRNDMRWNL